MKKYIFSVLIILSSLFIFTPSALAKVMYEEKGTLSIPESMIIDDDLFLGAENLDFSGIVNGSVFAGAGSADIGGTIKGDLILGSGRVSLTGVIEGDLYTGAGDITLTRATVMGNIIAGAGNISIDKDSKIGGSLIAGAGNLKNSAPIGRNAMIGAGNIYLDSKVGKEAHLGGGNIELGPLTTISGDLTYALQDETTSLKQDPSASIAGSVTRYTPPESARRDMDKARSDMARFGGVAKRGWLVISFFSSLIIGFILLKLFPKTFVGLSSTLSAGLISTLGTGLLITLLSVPVFVVLALTVVGIPLSLGLILIFCIALHLAKLIASIALGQFLSRQFNWKQLSTFATFALGLFIFYFLRVIPGIGWLVSILATWSGLGAIWLYTRSHLKNL